jgi:hypothetical protein
LELHRKQAALVGSGRALSGARPTAEGTRSPDF